VILAFGRPKMTRLFFTKRTTLKIKIFS